MQIQAKNEVKALEIELAAVSAGSGFLVSSKQQGVKLFVNGSEVGVLPQTIKNLPPGEHKVKFEGPSDRYAVVEKTITVTPDKVEDLGDIKLDVKKGKAVLQLVTRGAKIRLVTSDGENRQVDESNFSGDQFSVDIDTAKEWTLEATKAGYDDLKLPLSFADGQAEKTFRIELRERGKASDEVAKTTSPPRGAGGSAPAKPPAAGAAQPATGNGTLRINSIPPSRVMLDGRPVGQTPLSLSVSPGSHSVVFIHPEMGRKSASATVKAGETKSVNTRFP
ncbi:MAG: PEGA domain-containing protein [Polyangiaceae bacterium]|nr:PEGA domain-containing protein [Polyangiaceae bacterium]